MSILLNSIDPEGENIGFAAAASPKTKGSYDKYFKNCDLHNGSGSVYRTSATNIYQCKDGRYFHLHGSMNPEPTQDSVGLPHNKDVASPEESWAPYEEKLAQIDSKEMQRLASDVYKQAGTICWSTEEFKNSEHGKANAHVGLYEIHDVKNEKQPACWWPEIPETSAQRPLAGLKIVDLTRIIAAPAVSRGLAELGASVMRVTAEHITDMSALHVDLSWGKWNSHLDFRKEEDREKLRDLVREADVVIQGYRPGVLDKYGFSLDGLLELTKDRERGLIVVRENCVRIGRYRTICEVYANTLIVRLERPVVVPKRMATDFRRMLWRIAGVWPSNGKRRTCYSSLSKQRFLHWNFWCYCRTTCASAARSRRRLVQGRRKTHPLLQ